MTLIDLIIDQYERSSKWRGDLLGHASFRVEEQHYKLIGKSILILEAKELEREHLLRIRWVKGYYDIDIEKVEYPLSNLEAFYQRSGRIPKIHWMEQKLSLVQAYYDNIRSPWIRKYTEEEIFHKLHYGTDKHSLEEFQLLYQCFLGIDQLDAPIYKRIFSKRYLSNSKMFEKKLQSKILRIARKYSEDIEDTMEDYEVLSQLFIEEYAQELSVKGCLRLEVQGNIIDTGAFPFGTVLNTQTLKAAVILDNLQIKKVLTIENKANFVAESFEEGTLIIFCHGYFSPLEREFLIKLREKLTSREMIYLHSGDLDYGGVRIFRYIRTRIFPEVQPYRMDLDTFERYISYGEEIEEGPREKLMNIKELLLQDVIDRILETGFVIEQEAYL
jgi:hypothetical protein